jgi:N-hydroxyarylamine O-acetyltransferase
LDQTAAIIRTKSMNLNSYLKRIKISQLEKPNLSFLSKLQEKHLYTVPFENLDIHQGKKIVLEENRIYEKIVVSERGGFCYELNGLFCWLLRSLDFSVSMVSSQVYRSAEDTFTPKFDHMVLLANLEKAYLVDVGFGDTFRNPIALPDGIVEDISGTYRVQPFGSAPDTYILQKQENNCWQHVYSFTTHPRAISDFEEMCTFHQTSPESHFTQEIICTMATKAGRVSLSDHLLTITDGSSMKKTKVVSDKDFKHKLRDHFGIQLNDK